MPSSSLHTPDRPRIVEQLFGHLRGQRVLVIGVGGGGDVVGTLPTCFDLERIGAEVIPAGLTWKRRVHDPKGGPRAIQEFEQVEIVNDCIGVANPSTRVRNGGVQHIEAYVSALRGGSAVAMLDISGGSDALERALRDFCRSRGITAVLGVDAGGDVLCDGREPTLRSPLCDQCVLATLCRLDGALLGVFGLGGDGELPITDFTRRFAVFQRQGGYRGLLPMTLADIHRMQEVLVEAPTEASRLPVEFAATLTANRLDALCRTMNGPSPIVESFIEHRSLVTMRDGARTAELSDLSAATMFFDPKIVFGTSLLGTLWQPSATVNEMAELFRQQGICTELQE